MGGVLWTGNASARPILISTFQGYLADVEPSTGVVDPTTLVRTRFTASNVPGTQPNCDPNCELIAMYDIAYDPTDLSGGTLYGLSQLQSEPLEVPMYLFSIDRATGSSTLLLEVSDSNRMNALTFSNDGLTLYGMGADDERLFVIDPTAETVTPVGPGSGFTSSGDLAFDASGALYLAAIGDPEDILVLMDTFDGSGSAIGDGMDVKDNWGLAYSDGEMWGAAGTATYKIDLTTGKATNGMQFVDAPQNFGVAFGASAIPVPLPAAVWLGAALLTGLAAGRRFIS